MGEAAFREDGIFTIPSPFADPLRRRLFTLVQRSFELTLRLRQLNRIYFEIIGREGGGKEFADLALDRLNIRYEVKGPGLKTVPLSGPLLIVANHPYGGVDGLILISLLKRMRQDSKIMANYLLARIPELRHVLLSVDPFESRESSVRNIAPLRKGMDWLMKGHALAVFPAGSVSRLDLVEQRIQDPRWYGTVAKMVRKSGAPVVPVFFEGGNSTFFHAAGLVHPGLRTALLPHELLSKRNTTIEVRVGSLVPFEKLGSFDTDEKFMAYLRMRTYGLKDDGSVSAPVSVRAALPFRRPVKSASRTVMSWPRPGLGERDVRGLPSERLLDEVGGYRVFYAAAREIPHVLDDIGRLREVTFRESGEGTGKTSDLDRFDEYYTHLFVWHSEKKEVVGAYRLGLVDEILKRRGKSGLYTHTLFDYGSPFLRRVECGIELGRSFVRKEYQKLYTPLLMLWRGVARFISYNPRYRVLLGPVSISRAYTDLSRELMMTYLRINHYEPDLARLIKARNGIRYNRKSDPGSVYGDIVPGDMEELSSLISEIEADRKGVPVLLRQYVKLGGKLMGFSLDPSFGHVLDGLIMVDLLKCSQRILQKYMGPEGCALFFRYHCDTPPEGLAL